MSILKKIDKTRRRVMRSLTRRLGKTRIDYGADRGTTNDIRRVLICRVNHRLGNLLLVMPLLAEIGRVLPEAKIDLFVKGNIPPVIFKNYPNVNRIIRLPKKPAKHLFQYLKGWLAVANNRYDVAVNVVFNSSSGRISTQLARARFRFLGELDEDVRSRLQDHEHMAKFPVYGLRGFLRQLGVKVGDGPVPSLDIRLTADEVTNGRKTLDGLVHKNKRTIAIYTFATGAKCYDRDWWQRFYETLKIRFADYNIIEVLPIENVSQIGFQAPSFYSKDLRHIAAVIRNVDVFVGADSGMMHLASASQTPVVGLFKAKNTATYAPYNHGSIGVDTNEVSMDALAELVASRMLAPPSSGVDV